MTGAWNTKDGFSEPLTAHVLVAVPWALGAGWAPMLCGTQFRKYASLKDQSRQYYTPETSDVRVQALG